MGVWSRSFISVLLAIPAYAAGPFLQQTGNSSWVLGNDLWNITQGSVYGTKLYYKGQDLVGEAVGHYAGHDGEGNFVFTSADIVDRGGNYIDVRFTAAEAELHWIIFNDLAGAYQYFVNLALPVVAEVRTLFRLDNQTFTNGRTNIKDGTLPSFAEILSGTKVQDETWELSDGTFITKYDWSNFVRSQDFYGVYGGNFGSWYIRPSGDYLNGDQLKQELMVHRESATGDTVQLNMLHGSHFMASASDFIPSGKVFGPWLWYLNNGSREDAAARQEVEFAAWPYAWFNDTAYQSRAAQVSGTITLSDGRPAAGAAVFLGDNNPNVSSLEQGRLYYYATYAENDGTFTFENVRAGTYGIQAWGNGGILANTSTVFAQNDIVVEPTRDTHDLGKLAWSLPENRTKIFQLGDLDRKATGFRNGGAPYQHGLIASSPGNLTFIIGESDEANDWWFGQSSVGSWDVQFNISSADAMQNADRDALLTVSLAGFSKGSSGTIYVNGDKVGNLSSSQIASDPSTYRSATTAGEWHLFEFPVPSGSLVAGVNSVRVTVDTSSLWKGWLWDSLLLQWS